MDLVDVPGLHDNAFRAQRDVAAHVVANLVREEGVRTIYLEGSLAKGTGDPYSDVDLLVGVDRERMRDIWLHRQRIAQMPRDPILDLDHQWGDPSSLSYAVLYETGVYLDLTVVESPHVQTSDGIVLWSAPERVAGRNPSKRSPMAIRPDPFDDALRLFWVGSPLCAKYLVRNQLWTALWFIESRRAAFVRAWRLVHAPSHVEWGWSQVHEDVPGTVLEDLAKTVTPLEHSSLGQSLVDLMTLMEHYGPGLAETYGRRYPEEAATAVTRMVCQMLAVRRPG